VLGQLSIVFASILPILLIVFLAVEVHVEKRTGLESRKLPEAVIFK
jgi:hypothetical protein